jgi:hypothetical protein
VLDGGYRSTSRSGRFTLRENNSQYLLNWVGPTAGQDVFLRNFLPLPGIKPWIAQPIVSSLHRFGYVTNYEPFVYVSVHFKNQEFTKDMKRQLDDINRSKHVWQILVH